MVRCKPLSKDLGLFIIKAYQKGISARRISFSYSIPRSIVQDINLHKRAGGINQKKKNWPTINYCRCKYGSFTQNCEN